MISLTKGSKTGFRNCVVILLILEFPGLVSCQTCTIPNKTEVTATGTYFCPAGGSSLYRLDDLVQVEENIGCIGAEQGKITGHPCLCNFNSPSPATLITSLLEGVICSDSPNATETPTFPQVMASRSAKDPFLVSGLQCNETLRCIGVSETGFGNCQPILPIPAFLNDGNEDDRLYLYPSDGSRSIQENGPPCDCHDMPLEFKALSERGPNDVCHDTVAGWAWQEPPVMKRRYQSWILVR